MVSLELKRTERINQQLVGMNMKSFLPNYTTAKKVNGILDLTEDQFSSLDYKKGFGGQFGIQTDRKDKSAAGWEHHENLEPNKDKIGIFQT